MLDLKGQVEGLRRQLRTLKFNQTVNYQGMIQGEPSAFVDFYRRLLCDFNADLTSKLVEKGFGLLGTSDFRFMEVVYRILRDLMNLRPTITLNQFYSSGFAERKLEMAASVAHQVAVLISPARRSRRGAHLANGLTSTGRPNGAAPGPLVCRTRSASTRVLRSVGQSVPQTLPGVCLVGSRHSSNEPVTRPYTTEGMHVSRNPNLGDRISGLSHSSELGGKDQPQNEYYDQIWEEKPVARPPTFVQVDSYCLPMWAEESHNQAAIRHRSQINFRQSREKKRDDPAVFSSTIPAVAQSSQLQQQYSQRCGSLISSAASAKHENQYPPSNRKARPGAFKATNMENPTVMKSCDRDPASTVFASTSNGLTNTTSKPSTQVACTRVNSDMIYESGNDRSPLIHPETMREILHTLSQLNGKVDGLIVRLGALETRLSTAETVSMSDQMVLHNSCEPENDRSSYVLRREASNPQEVACLDRLPVSQSEPSALFSTTRPPGLSSATAPKHQKSVCPGSSEPPLDMDSSSYTSGYIAPPNTTKAGWPKRVDGFHTPNSVHGQLHFTTSVSMEQRSLTGNSSITQPSPSKVTSISSQGLLKPVASHSETYRSTSLTETANIPRSIYSMPDSGDTMKSALGDLSKRGIRSSLPTVTHTSEFGSRPGSSSPKHMEFLSDSRYSQHTAESERHPVASADALMSASSSCGSRRQEPFGRTCSSLPAETSRSMQACDSVKSNGNTFPQEIDSKLTSEPYHNQVNRIAAMLAETQGLLETQRSNLVNGTA